MKKTIFLIAAFVFAAVISHAQTEKGNQTLGVDLGFGYTKNNGITISPIDNSGTSTSSKYTYFNIGPSYSYFIADKLDIGAQISYQCNNYNYPATAGGLEKQSSYTYGGNVFIRKYIMFKDKLGLRAGAYAGYSRADNKLTYNDLTSAYDQDTKQNGYDAGLRLDLVYYPSKHLGVAASFANLSYQHAKSDSGNQGSGSSDNLNFSFINNNLSLSLFYVFGGK